MKNLDEIIFAVFNAEEYLDSNEEKLLKEKYSEIYDFYNNNNNFSPEILTGLNETLQNKIKDIEIESKCDQCGKKYKTRYKYLPYLEPDIYPYINHYCDECIKDFVLDYVTLRKIEENFKQIEYKYSELEITQIKKWNKINEIFKDVNQEKMEIGKWISEYSKNHLIKIDEVTAYYKIDCNTVYISSNANNGEKINNISDIKQFNEFNVKYDSDCKNIELRFKDYCNRPYYYDKRGAYIWIVPNGKNLILSNNYHGDFGNCEIDFVDK